MMVIVAAASGAGGFFLFSLRFYNLSVFGLGGGAIHTYLSLHISAIKLLTLYSPNTIFHEVHDIIARFLWQLCLWLFCLSLVQFRATQSSRITLLPAEHIFTLTLSSPLPSLL